MKAIVLCAGYGTRLYPLTKTTAKPLLPIAGKPILDRIVDKLFSLSDVDEVFVTSNSKFACAFESWREGHAHKEKITLFVNDSHDVTEEISPLHDLSDLLLQGDIDDDLLIVAGDNLFSFSLKEFTSFAHAHKGISLVGFCVPHKRDARRFGVLEVEQDKIVGFEEKPEQPKTNLISSAIYFFPKDHAPLIGRVGKRAKASDNIGHLILELAKTEDVFCFISDKPFFDIGTLDDYKRANATWKD